MAQGCWRAALQGAEGEEPSAWGRLICSELLGERAQKLVIFTEHNFPGVSFFPFFLFFSLFFLFSLFFGYRIRLLHLKIFVVEVFFADFFFLKCRCQC